MKVRYDKKVDILTIIFSKNPIVESGEVRPGIILDYDKSEALVSIEILDASKTVSDPEKVELFISDGETISPATDT